MANLNKYKNILILNTLAIPGGGTESGVYDCLTSPDLNGKGRGASVPRRLVFPSNWTAGDVTITLYDDFGPEGSPDIITSTLYLSDGQDAVVQTIPALPDASVPLVPYGTDSVTSFSITCSVPQGDNVLVGVVCAPIYQGFA